MHNFLDVFYNKLGKFSPKWPQSCTFRTILRILRPRYTRCTVILLNSDNLSSFQTPVGMVRDPSTIRTQYSMYSYYGMGVNLPTDAAKITNTMS